MFNLGAIQAQLRLNTQDWSRGVAVAKTDSVHVTQDLKMLGVQALATSGAIGTLGTSMLTMATAGVGRIGTYIGHVAAMRSTAVMAAREIDRAYSRGAGLGVVQSNRAETAAIAATTAAYSAKAASALKAGLAIGGAALGVGLLVDKAKDAVMVAAEWESAWTGVEKTVDGTTEQLATLRRQLTDMTRVMPIPMAELFGVAEAGGQLGVPMENIAEFTRAITEVGVASNLTAQDAAVAFARWANITRLPITEIEKLTSSVVALGNASATSEREIVEMGLRMAGVATTAGFSNGEIVGLAASLSSLGLQSEAGGSAMIRILMEMDKAVRSSSKELDLYAAIANKTTSEFSNLWEQDAKSALLSFLEGLGRFNAEGEDAYSIMEKLALISVNETRALIDLSTAVDDVTTNMAMGNEEFDKGTAAQIEAAKRFDDTNSLLVTMKNSFSELASEIGEIFQPAFNSMIRDVIWGVNAIATGFDLMNRARNNLKGNMSPGGAFTGGPLGGGGSFPTGFPMVDDGSIPTGSGGLFAEIRRISIEDISGGIGGSIKSIVDEVSGAAAAVIAGVGEAAAKASGPTSDFAERVKDTAAALGSGGGKKGGGLESEAKKAARALEQLIDQGDALYRSLDPMAGLAYDLQENLKALGAAGFDDSASLGLLGAKFWDDIADKPRAFQDAVIEYFQAISPYVADGIMLARDYADQLERTKRAAEILATEQQMLRQYGLEDVSQPGKTAADTWLEQADDITAISGALSQLGSKFQMVATASSMAARIMRISANMAKGAWVAVAEEAILFVVEALGIMGDESEKELKGIEALVDELKTKSEEWARSLSDEIAELVRTGKADFQDLFDSILQEMISLATFHLVVNPAIDFLGGALFAKGGAFDKGNVIPFARGGVVSQPTLFPMAKGMGLMGEAGPEAVLPLKRLSGGRLGVSANGQPVINIIDQRTGADPAVQVKNSRRNGRDEIDVIIKSAVREGFARGEFDPDMRLNYGLVRRGA